MKFATLFLIASAVLAMPTGEKANNNVELAKKEAASSGALAYPTEDQDDPDSPNYRFKMENGQVPGRPWNPQNQNNKPQQNVPVKDRKDNNGNDCTSYIGKALKDIPEECMKTVFCRNNDIGYGLPCDPVSFTKDNWTKQKLLDEPVANDCVFDAICKTGDWY